VCKIVQRRCKVTVAKTHEHRLEEWVRLEGSSVEFLGLIRFSMRGILWPWRTPITTHSVDGSWMEAQAVDPRSFEPFLQLVGQEDIGELRVAVTLPCAAALSVQAFQGRKVGVSSEIMTEARYLDDADVRVGLLRRLAEDW
jgi:hypothetical protein